MLTDEILLDTPPEVLYDIFCEQNTRLAGKYLYFYYHGDPSRQDWWLQRAIEVEHECKNIDYRDMQAQIDAIKRWKIQCEIIDTLKKETTKVA